MVPSKLLLLFVGLAACAGAGTEPEAVDGGDEVDEGADEGADAGVDLDADSTSESGLSATFYKRYFEARKTEVIASLDLDWGLEGPGAGVLKDYWSLRAGGELYIEEAGRYGFRADVDDGLRLWIGDRLVIDDWEDGSQTLETVEVDLEAGWQPIEVEYYEATGPASLRLLWRPPGQAEGPIPIELLRAIDTSAAPSPQPNYINPVTPYGCADPGALRVGDWNYVVCTGGRMRIRRSRDLVKWENTDVYLMPPAGKPPWSSSGTRNWAPELHKVGDTFVAYFTANDSQGRLSVGAAVADSMDGPFVHQSGPLVTHPDGVIDANFFEDDDGRRYLIYKIDGNAHGRPTPNYIRELRPNGLGFKAGSTQTEILRNTLSWEGAVAEGAWLHKRGNTYYLFYSGNGFNYRYRTGVARSSSITGPYQKFGDPILGNNNEWVGPGHGSIVSMGGMNYWVYHAWPTTESGAQDSSKGRLMMVDRIDWSGGWPRIESDGTPSLSPRARPGSRQICQVAEEIGECRSTASCGGSSTPGQCKGAANIQCCIQ